MRLYLLLMLVALGLCAIGADWPRFLGPNANGISPDTGINKNWNQQPPKQLWKISLNDGGYAGPAVAYGKVFIIDHQGAQDIIRMLDLNTGNEDWHYSYTDTDKDNFGFSRCTPLISFGKVYTVSRTGNVVCLETKTGKLVWMRNLVADFGGRRPQWDYSWSMIVDDNKLLVQPGGPNAAVAALNPATGATIWAGGGSDVPGYATPVVATLNGKKQYIFFTAGGLLGIDPANGSRLWNYPWKTGCDVNAATPVVIDNSVFITADYGHGSALVNVTAQGAATAWADKTVMSRFTSPIYANGCCFVTTEANQIMCFDPKTGAVKWQHPGFGWGGLCGVDGTLIVCDGNTGEVAMIALDTTGYKELGRIKPLGGQSWTAPIVADGKLIVRNKNAMACLALK